LSKKLNRNTSTCGLADLDASLEKLIWNFAQLIVSLSNLLRMINLFSTDMMMFLIFQSFQLNHFLNDLKSTGHYSLLELILHDLFVFGNGLSSSNSSHILQSSRFCFNATFSIFLRFSYTLLCFYTKLLNVHFLRFYFSEFF
jgi:hypothetical protein